MCLIAFAWNAHPRLRLLLAANRDEFHARPSEPLHAWPDHPQLLGGRDALALGTWLAVNREGRLAAVTNVRLPQIPPTGLLSRGALVNEFLLGTTAPADFMDALPARMAAYGPCNLLLATPQLAAWAGNHPQPHTQRLAPGLYGLSNAALDTPWPKTVALKARVQDWLMRGAHDDFAPLFAALADPRTPPDDQLPDTGIGLLRERYVAPAFIRGAEYGTRCSSVVAVDARGRGVIVERRFGPRGIALGETRIEFSWQFP